MAEKKDTKKVAKKKVAKKKTDTVPTRKVENKCDIKTDKSCIEFVKELRNTPSKFDYNRYYYDELDLDRVDKWAREHPSPTPKKTPEWKNLPNQNSREWDNLPYQVRQLNYKPTDEDMMDKPNYFSVMELAKKYPEQRAFFFSLARYMESVSTRMTTMGGVLSKARRGEKLTFEDGLKLQWAYDMMLEDFVALRKAVKKAKE